jgi:spore maturation protein CgeB
VRLLVVGPGASWSVADVEAGLLYGLQAHGVSVARYRMDVHIKRADSWLFYNYRRAKKGNPAIEKPTRADVIYQAGADAIASALRHGVDAVLVVSAMFLHPDIAVLMRRAGLRVFVLFTESPYDMDGELRLAALVDGCWTNERSAVPAFRAVNPRSGYLGPGWHPERHRVDVPVDPDVPAHDVVFVGTGFPERVRWFRSIDWSGIDLGLYGNWDELRKGHPLRQYVRGGLTDNRFAAHLYRRAKVGLNLYRTSTGWGGQGSEIPAGAESLNPRAVELAACGAFHLSDFRTEVVETFGDLVPTFRSPSEASALIRAWLADEAGRARVSAALPARVAESSWLHRAASVIGDLQAIGV